LEQIEKECTGMKNKKGDGNEELTFHFIGIDMGNLTNKVKNNQYRQNST
jgi:hypothetical protein